MASSPPPSTAAPSSPPAPVPRQVPSDSVQHPPSVSYISTSHPHRQLLFPSHWRHLSHLSEGAGPFITKLVHQTPSGHQVSWESRKHRKRIPQSTISTKQATPPISSKDTCHRLFPFYPRRIAYWTAVLFDVGSVCFVFSSICSFIPSIYNSEYFNTAYVGWTAFSGSVCFTIGAVFGVLEVIKSPLMAKYYPMKFEEEKWMESQAKSSQGGQSVNNNEAPTMISLMKRLDFWVTMISLIGTISFNINTFSFTGSFNLTQDEMNGLVFFCDVFASCCFTLSGYLSILEVTHSLLPFSKHPSKDLQSLDWYVTWFNFLGGVGFLLNGILLIYFPNAGQLPPAYPLLIGSCFFQIGSHLQYVEQGDKYPSVGTKSGVSQSAEGGQNGVAKQRGQEAGETEIGEREV